MLKVELKEEFKKALEEKGVYEKFMNNLENRVKSLGISRNEKIKELNKAAAFSSKKLSELNVFLSQLKPGATLYYLRHHHDEKFDFSGNWYQQIEIASITNPYISRLDEDHKGFYNDLELQEYFTLDDKKVFKITEKSSWGCGDVITSLDLLGGVLWLNKPIELKDNIV